MMGHGLEILLIIGQKYHCLWPILWGVLKLSVSDLEGKNAGSLFSFFVI
jgi:hypothetical protein